MSEHKGLTPAATWVDEIRPEPGHVAADPEEREEESVGTIVLPPAAAAEIRRFQAAHSWVADPGTEVVATVTGSVERRNTRTGTIHVRTPAGALVTLPADADVHVVEVQPERPTLEQRIRQEERERIAALLALDAPMNRSDALYVGAAQIDGAALVEWLRAGGEG